MAVEIFQYYKMEMAHFILNVMNSKILYMYMYIVVPVKPQCLRNLHDAQRIRNYEK